MTQAQIINTVAYYLMAAIWLSIVITRWRRHVKKAGPATPEFLAMLVFLSSLGAAAAILAIPTRHVLDLVYPNLAQLVGNLMVIVAGGALVATVSFSQSDSPTAVRRVRRRCAGFVVIAVAMTVCFLNAHIGAAQFFVPGTEPGVIGYYALYSVAFGWTAIDLIILLTRQLKLETVRWRRVGVRLNRMSCIFIVIYLIGRLWTVTAGPLGLVPPATVISAVTLESIIGTFLPLIGMLIGSAGLMSQFWAPRVVRRLTDVARSLRYRRLYRQLAPLWGLASQGELAAVYLPERHRRALNPTMQLCGRVVELCDVELRAARHTTPEDRQRAVQAALDAGLSHTDSEAEGDALVLAVGIPIERRHNPPQEEPERNIPMSVVDNITMVDVETQARRLLLAYRAIRRSPGTLQLIRSTEPARGASNR